MTERLRSPLRSDVTCALSRCRSSTRKSAVTITVNRAIATTSRTCVRTPSLRLADAKREKVWVSEDSVWDSWDKFVPCAVDCEQMLRIGRICLQLLAQLQNLIVDGARRRISIVTPDFIEKNFAGQYAIDVL